MSEVELSRDVEPNTCDECHVNYDDLLDFSYPLLYTYENETTASRSVSSSFSDSNSVTSEDAGYTNLELHHFHKALNQGVFNEVRKSNKKERKKSFGKGFQKSNEDISDDSWKYSSAKKEPSLRARSISCDTSSKSRKKSKNGKIKNTLSSSGINLHHVDDKLSLEEIHELQQKLFTNLKIDKTTTKRQKGGLRTINYENNEHDSRNMLFNANVINRPRSATFM